MIKGRERHLAKPLIEKGNHFEVFDVIKFEDIRYFFISNFLEIDFVIKTNDKKKKKKKKKHRKTSMLITFTFLTRT